MTKQEMKNEAIARMRMLKIYGNAIAKANGRMKSA